MVNQEIQGALSMHLPAMRKRWWLALALVVVVSSTILYASGCFKRVRWDMDIGSAPPGFETLPGALGVRFKSWSEGEWHYRYFVFRAGKVESAASLPVVDANANVGGGEERAPWLPHIPGVPYDGPYAKSPSGKFVAAGVERVGTHHSITRLVIADMATGEEFASIDTGDGWGILGVAWSPDERFVAVMKVISKFQLCPPAAVAYWMGHPVRLYTLSLVVVDLDGNVVATAPLLKDSDTWGAEVVWQ